MRSIATKYRLGYFVTVLFVIPCLFISTFYSAPSAAQENNFTIKSMEIVKVGNVALKRDAGQNMLNELFGTMPELQSNPHYIGRPVLIRIGFSCNRNPKKEYTMNVESEQKENKWGEWETDTDIVDRALFNHCDNDR
jgi:hypothetical protein